MTMATMSHQRHPFDFNLLTATQFSFKNHLDLAPCVILSTKSVNRLNMRQNLWRYLRKLQNDQVDFE